MKTIQRTILGWCGRAAAACALMLGAGTASRAAIELRVDFGGGTVFDIVAPGSSYTLTAADLAALNGGLSGVAFSGLTATSSSPIGNPGTLTVSGTVTNPSSNPDGSAGPITVLASSDAYNTGGPSPTTMGSSAQSTFTNAVVGGWNTSFQSFFDPNNTLIDGNTPPTPGQIPGTPLPLVNTTTGINPPDVEQATVTDPLPQPQPPLYSLTNVTVLNIGNRSITTSDGTLQFQNATTVTAAAVPEPTTIASALAGLGLMGLGWARRRKV